MAYTLFGNGGQIAVDVNTGAVLGYFPEAKSIDHEEHADYSKITRVDLAEWRNFLLDHGLGDASIADDKSTDILNVGYWVGDEYEPPANDYRQIWLPDAVSYLLGTPYSVWRSSAKLLAKSIYGYAEMVYEHEEYFQRAHKDRETPFAAVKAFGDKYELNKA